VGSVCLRKSMCRPTQAMFLTLHNSRAASNMLQTASVSPNIPCYMYFYRKKGSCGFVDLGIAIMLNTILFYALYEKSWNANYIYSSDFRQSAVQKRLLQLDYNLCIFVSDWDNRWSLLLKRRFHHSFSMVVHLDCRHHHASYLHHHYFSTYKMWLF